MTSPPSGVVRSGVGVLRPAVIPPVAVEQWARSVGGPPRCPAGLRRSPAGGGCRAEFGTRVRQSSQPSASSQKGAPENSPSRRLIRVNCPGSGRSVPAGEEPGGELLVVSQAAETAKPVARQRISCIEPPYGRRRRRSAVSRCQHAERTRRSSRLATPPAEGCDDRPRLHHQCRCPSPVQRRLRIASSGRHRAPSRRGAAGRHRRRARRFPRAIPLAPPVCTATGVRHRRRIGGDLAAFLGADEGAQVAWPVSIPSSG